MKFYRQTMLALAFVTVAPLAMAQQRVTAVADKVAADYAPMGVRAGSFLVIPKVDVEEVYNDNIYASANNTKSDFITTVRPQVAVRSNWNRHALNALASVEVNRYADQDDENHTNFNVAVDGRVDVMRDTSVGGGVAMTRTHEDRGEPTALGASTEPTQIDTTVARIGAFRSVGKINARVDSEARQLDYKNGSTVTGAVVNNNLRDRNEFTQSVRVGYQFDNRFEGFVKASFDNRVYDNKSPTNRSNRGQTFTVGSTFDVSGKTKGEVFVGTTERNYTSTALKDTDTMTFGGKVTWNPSELTTVLASVDRGIEETTLGAASGYVATNYRLGVQHALTRQIVLNANTGVSNNEYEGLAANQREDDIWTAGVGADYWLNKNLKAGVSYDYLTRESNVVNGDYDRNAIMLRLTATY